MKGLNGTLDPRFTRLRNKFESAIFDSQASSAGNDQIISRTRNLLLLTSISKVSGRNVVKAKS